MGDVKDMVSGMANKAQEAMGGKDEKHRQLDKDSRDYMDSSACLTTDFGVKQSNTDDWLKVATEDKTGPMLLEDGHGREKIHRFDHERIPERVVHARGAGAFGTFKCTYEQVNLNGAFY